MSPNCPLLNPYLPLTCLCDALWHEEQDFLFGAGQGILPGGEGEGVRFGRGGFPLLHHSAVGCDGEGLRLGDSDDERMRVAFRTGDMDSGMRDDGFDDLGVGLLRGSSSDGNGAFVVGVEDRIEVSVPIDMACP